MGRNTFSRALKHLKSSQIDEKTFMISETPTNNTSNLYALEPDKTEIDPNGTTPPDFNKDDLPTGRDTTGLFEPDGRIKVIEPPGDTSYILGPMAEMWYAWGNFTQIGYIRQSDRRMVNLARITGPMSSWNGTSGFLSYGQLTLEQAQWFKNTYRINYRAFYPGPPSNVPDQYGRYLCTMTGTPKDPPERRVPGKKGDQDKAGFPWGLFGDNSRSDKRTVVKGKKKGGLKVKTVYHGTSKAGERGIRSTGFRTTKTGLSPNKVWVGDKSVAQRYAQGGYSSGSMAKNSPSQQSVMKLRIPKGSGVTVPGPFGRETAISKQTADVGAGLKPSRVSSGARAGTTVQVTGMPRGGGSGSLVQPVEPWISKTDPLQGYTYNYKTGKYQLANSYEDNKKVLSENAQRIIRDIKKPYVLPEVTQEKIKRRPKVIGILPRTINSDLMKQAEVPTSFKPAEERLWGKYEKKQNERMSQDKKNVVLDHLGASDHAWEYLLERNRSKDKYYGFYDKDGTPHKIVRKEDVKGETLLFIADENGKKESILQSELNDRLDYEFNKELFEKYFAEQETLQAEKDPLFKKVSKALKKEIDYTDKPSKFGYPNENPPEMVSGYHPDLVDGEKISNAYNKLDPHSANSMPLTTNPHIDTKVQKAKRLKSVKDIVST